MSHWNLADDSTRTVGWWPIGIGRNTILAIAAVAVATSTSTAGLRWNGYRSWHKRKPLYWITWSTMRPTIYCNAVDWKRLADAHRRWQETTNDHGRLSPYVQAGLQAFYASLHAPPILLLECYCELLCCARRPWSQIAVCISQAYAALYRDMIDERHGEYWRHVGVFETSTGASANAVSCTIKSTVAYEWIGVNTVGFCAERINQYMLFVTNV